MKQRAGLRRRLAWTVLAVLLCSAVGSLRLRPRRRPPSVDRSTCAAAGRDSTRIARFAADTIATLRARTQLVRRFSLTVNGVEVRTEDNDTLSAHDGGLAAFDCAGRLTFLWLDGG